MPPQNGTGAREPKNESRGTTQQTSSPTEAHPVADAETSSPPQVEQKQVEQRQEPPGRTPDTPPLATPATESVPPPKAIPDSEDKPLPPIEDEPERTASESLYGEDLPPDFWDSDPVAEVEARAATQNKPRPDEVFGGSSRSPAPSPQPRQEVTGKLTDDPRFAVMQSLFPGQIVAWQDSEEVADADESEVDSANDPNEDPDGLELETDS